VNDLKDDDLKHLLGLALADGHGPHPLQPVDPAADLMRGRRLLRRRRAVRAGGFAATAAACVAVAAVALGGGNAATGAPPAAGGDQPASTAPQAPATGELRSIALVAYDGRQVPGYRVAEVPRGWEVQGGNAFALTIGPRGAADQEPNSFAGKLVVMLQSRDAGVPDVGASQPVDGRPGRLDVQGDTQILTYQRADDRWVVIQAPTSLGWDGDRIARFATGVEVLDNAEPGVG
jgi:hypothetical protein